MWFLFSQAWFWMLVCFVLGWLAHWYYASPSQSPAISLHGHKNNTVEAKPNLQDSPPEQNDNSEEKPQLYSERPNQFDDLKQIKGIGTVNEKALNELGIYKFVQIAEWTTEHIQWVESSLSFPGRIKREDWVKQAQDLIS